MAIAFRCPTCNSALTVADECTGLKTPCIVCGQKLIVPAPPPKPAAQNKTVLGVWEPPPDLGASQAVQPPPAILLPPLGTTEPAALPSFPSLDDAPEPRRSRRRDVDRGEVLIRNTMPLAAGPLDVAGFVCGLVGLVFFCIPLIAWPLGLMGVIFGISGMSQARGRQPSWQAIAAAILGGVALVLGTLMFLIFLGDDLRRQSRF